MRLADDAAHREGRLLAELASQQQKREEAERLALELAAKREEAELRAQELEARLRVTPPAAVEPQSWPMLPATSVRPAGEGMRFKGEWSISDLRGWKGIVVGIITAMGAAFVANIKAFQPTPPPVVVDNAAPLKELTESVKTLRDKLAVLEAHARAVDNFNTTVFEAACIDVRRNTPYTPLTTVYMSTKRPKCPTVRILEPQPTLPVKHE